MKHSEAITGIQPDPLPEKHAGTLAERLFNDLTEAILKGEIPLGSKISEPLLARKYAVSRGPLREALHRLQERHLITRSANQGARVTEATPEKLSDLFKVRMMLESLAAREAAATCTQADLARLAGIIEDHEAQLAGAAPERHTALGSTDRDFHFLIAQRSNNPLLIRLLCEELYPLLRLYRSRNDNIDLRRRALIEHRRIYDALCDRDQDMAEMAMRRHIEGARSRRLTAMEP